MRVKSHLFGLLLLAVAGPAVAQTAVPSVPPVPAVVSNTTAAVNTVEGTAASAASSPAWLASKGDWKSRFSAGAHFGGGALSDGSVPVYKDDDVLVGYGRASQGIVETNIWTSYDLIDLCRTNTTSTCIKAQPKLSFHAGAYAQSAMAYLQLLIGANVEVYFGGQRTVALTAGAGTGYMASLIPAVENQENNRILGNLGPNYQKNPAYANIPVGYLNIGGKLNFTNLVGNEIGKNFSVLLDVRLQNAAGFDTGAATMVNFLAGAAYHF